MSNETKLVSKKNLATFGGVFLFGVVITVGSIMWGRSDVGQIDVSATIARTNVENREHAQETGEAIEQIPDSFAETPNGGLMPQAKGTEPSPVPDPEPEPTPAPEVQTASTTPTIENAPDATVTTQ